MSDRARKLLTGFVVVCVSLWGYSLQAQDAKDSVKEVPATAKALEPFQGTWQLDRVEADGRPLPPDLFGTATLEVKGTGYNLARKTSKEVQVKGSLAIPGAKAEDQPNGKDKASGADLVAIDITPQADGKPLETQKAVFALIDGKLHLCSGPPGTSRPGSMNTLARENVTLMVFSRKKQ